MIPIDRLRASLKANFPRAAAMVEPHFDTLRKAVTFALIGLVNAVIDTAFFLLAYSYLKSGDAALRPLDALAQRCACAKRGTLMLHAANNPSWVVAVALFFVMNSFITFAAESGR